MELRVKIATASICAAFILLCSLSGSAGNNTRQPSWMEGSVMKLEKELVSKYGKGQQDAIKRGIVQVSELWNEEDGDSEVLGKFVLENYAGEPAARDAMFKRFEFLFCMVCGCKKISFASCSYL